MQPIIQKSPAKGLINLGFTQSQNFGSDFVDLPSFTYQLLDNLPGITENVIFVIKKKKFMRIETFCQIFLLEQKTYDI